MRDIVIIDEGKCDGCGQCVRACAEGAIEIIDGKAKLISEIYCDGLGVCLGECPTCENCVNADCFVIILYYYKVIKSIKLRARQTDKGER